MKNILKALMLSLALSLTAQASIIVKAPELQYKTADVIKRFIQEADINPAMLPISLRAELQPKGIAIVNCMYNIMQQENRNYVFEEEIEDEARRQIDDFCARAQKQGYCCGSNGRGSSTGNGPTEVNPWVAGGFVLAFVIGVGAMAYSAYQSSKDFQKADEDFEKRKRKIDEDSENFFKKARARAKNF